MKSLIITVLALVGQTLPSAAAYAQDGIAEAFQSEYIYLASQKEALLRQKEKLIESFGVRTAQTKAKVIGLQRELARQTAVNDEKHEMLVELERQKKELARRGTSLESTFKKASKALAETEKGLRFESAKDKREIVVPIELTVHELDPFFARADELLKASSRMETYDGYFLDRDDKLTQGKVTRVGRIAAFVGGESGNLALGPNGAGTLKALDQIPIGSVFVFDSLNEAARIQRPATLLENIADAGPLLFLAMMLAMVASLFYVLVKI